jgi:quercetin dioxygenase-like cupin family protein
MSSGSGFSVVDIAELAGEGPGGMVKKLRRALGARAFGFNYFTLPPGQEGREHNHSGNNQEEVYFVVRGTGKMRVGDEEIELIPGRFVRVDPDAVRMPIASDEGLEFVTFGAPIDGGYEPPEWGLSPASSSGTLPTR